MKKAKANVVSGGPRGQNPCTAANKAASHGACPPCSADNGSSQETCRPCWRWLRGLEWLALAGAVVLGLCLAWRPMASVDLGYHLAYGSHLVQTKQIIDWNEFVYTPAHYAGVDESMNIGPGCWYEQSTGRYRFPNANWASQGCMALAAGTAQREMGRGGDGETGLRTLGGDSAPFTQAAVRLTYLQFGLAGLALVLMVVAMARLGVGPLWMAGAMALAAWAMYERFNLRPEMFGFAFLAMELALLARGKLGARGAIALIVVQWVFVQFHSYWLFGLAMTGPFAVVAVVRAARARAIRGTSKDMPARILNGRIRGGMAPGGGIHAGMAPDSKWIVIAFAGMVLVTFANPWGWRLAALPIQTVLAVGAHDSGSPFARITEFMPTFSGKVVRATYAAWCLVGLAAIGGIVGLFMRRWAQVLVIVIFGGIMLSMRRNVAPAAIVLVPVSMAMVCEARRAIAARRRPAGEMAAGQAGGTPATQWVRIAATGLAIVVLGLWIFTVATSRFYYGEQSSWRFGSGISMTDIPFCAWSRQGHDADVGNYFTDFNDSSNAMYFLGGGRHQVPVLTNGLAYPPQTLAQNMAICGEDVSQNTDQAYKAFFKENNVGLVAIDVSSLQLARQLAADDEWQLRYCFGRHMVFGRPWPEALWSTDRVIWLAQKDPFPAYPLWVTGGTLLDISFGPGGKGAQGSVNPYWLGEAMILLTKATECDPYWAAAWTRLAWCHYYMGLAKTARMDPSGRKDLQQAREFADRALGLDAGQTEAIKLKERL